jgi:hypothetical protein
LALLFESQIVAPAVAGFVTMAYQQNGVTKIFEVISPDRAVTDLDKRLRLKDHQPYSLIAKHSCPLKDFLLSILKKAVS